MQQVEELGWVSGLGEFDEVINIDFNEVKEFCDAVIVVGVAVLAVLVSIIGWVSGHEMVFQGVCW